MILGLSTSSTRGSVALVEGDVVLATECYVGLEDHAERLFAAIDAVLVRSGRSKADIRRVACDVGPGSFTGVRVGVATAEGIALALGVPCLGVGSLEAMAFEANDRAALAVLDAKKGEAFVETFDASGKSTAAATHVPIEAARLAIQAAHARGLIIVGEEADALVPGVALRSAGADLPDAASIARIAERAQDPAEHPSAPRYVRPPDAKPMAAALSVTDPVDR